MTVSFLFNQLVCFLLVLAASHCEQTKELKKNREMKEKKENAQMLLLHKVLMSQSFLRNKPGDDPGRRQTGRQTDRMSGSQTGRQAGCWFPGTSIQSAAANQTLNPPVGLVGDAPLPPHPLGYFWPLMETCAIAAATAPDVPPPPSASSNRHHLLRHPCSKAA